MIDLLDWDGEPDDRLEIWGQCGLCGAPLQYQDGDCCPNCGEPIDDDADAIGDEQEL